MNIIDRVKYNGPGDVFAWRWPHDSLVWGTQVIVNQAQEAVFYKDGKALDVLGPGRHTLKSANIPLLEHLVNLPFDNLSPFAAEIYYVNKAVNLDMKWGTQEPIPILEPVYNVYIPLRAFGQFGIKITNAKRFVTTLVGTVDEFNAEQIINYFRGHLMSRIKDFISRKVINDKISVLNISAHLNEMSVALQHDIRAEFNRFGIEIVNFYLNSINVPQDDDSVIRLKEILAKKAEFDIYGETYNTVKMFDVAEKAASNEGAGGVAGAGVGMGVGFGIGNQMMKLNSASMANEQSTITTGPSCSSCQHTIPQGAKFCPSCGSEQVQVQAQEKTFCTDCGTEKPLNAKFCPGCGKKQ